MIIGEKKQKKQSKKSKKKTFSLLTKKKTRQQEINDLDQELSKTIHSNDHQKLVYTPEELKEFVYSGETSKLALQYYKNKYMTSLRRDAVFLIHMTLRNKKTMQFFIANTRPLFVFNNGCYIIDSSCVLENLSAGYPTLYYHQDCSLPYVSDIDRELIKDKAPEEVSLNVYPEVLKATIETKVAEAVMAGGVLDKQIKILLILIIVMLVLMGINTLALLINFIR